MKFVYNIADLSINACNLYLLCEDHVKLHCVCEILVFLMTNGFTILLPSCVTLPLPSTHRTKTQTGITCEKILL